MRMLGTVAFLALTSLLSGCVHLSIPSAATAPAPQSFFTTVSNFQIVDVTAAGDGAHVRIVEFDYAEDVCWSRMVRAYEVALPQTSVSALASAPVCGLTQQRVNDASVKARERFFRGRDGIPTGTPFKTVVGICNGEERRLVFSDERRPAIDGAALARIDADVYALWTIGERVAALAAPRKPDHDTQVSQGTIAARELLAGRYDAAFRDQCWNDTGWGAPCSPRYWAQILDGYTGPEARAIVAPELLERERWQFARYVAPVYPPIAMSARIQGDVLLRLVVNTSTGDVTEASIVTGQPLLDASALGAALHWRFATGALPADPFVVTVRYAMRCG